MADINRRLATLPDDAPRERASRGTDTLLDLIELFFFAYRDFVSDPDTILARYGFGRAHHRVLHFVNRNPGLTVADLLEILKITKQSLGRVLKELVDSGFIEQRTGSEDRRQRLLYATDQGSALALSLSEPQSLRLRAALAELGPEAHDTATRFLFGMVDQAERPNVSRLARKDGKA